MLGIQSLEYPTREEILLEICNEIVVLGERINWPKFQQPTPDIAFSEKRLGSGKNILFLDKIQTTAEGVEFHYGAVAQVMHPYDYPDNVFKELIATLKKYTASEPKGTVAMIHSFDRKDQTFYLAIRAKASCPWGHEMAIKLTNIVRDKTKGIREAFDDYGVVCTWQDM